MTARRLRIEGSGGSLCEAVRSLADRLAVRGWARVSADGGLCVHAEGDESAVGALVADVRSLADADSVAEQPAAVEGHEQFALRGVPAGVFVVQEHQATAHHFDFRLQVGEVMRSWAVPKGPSMDPAVKRFAIQVEDHSLAHNDFEGAAGNGAVIVWDRGVYERSGRVPWPEALERGHAVFVLRGEKLRGGFALQRTRGGPKAQWLLIKRRDDEAAPGSDVVAQRPESVHSGLTLAAVLAQQAVGRA